ncbi:MAG: hypothetical protein ACRDS0_31205 [Pseudonocardiaceae bacterium]
MRSFEALSQRFSTEPVRNYPARMVAGERIALGALQTFTAAVELDGPAQQAYEPVPGCQVYPSYVARLARDRLAGRGRGRIPGEPGSLG